MKQKGLYNKIFNQRKDYKFKQSRQKNMKKRNERNNTHKNISVPYIDILNNINLKEKILRIKINEKINEIKNENIIEIFNIIHAFRKLEIKKGNEYESAWIKIKYTNNMLETKYLNIFKLVRNPNLNDFVEYLKTIKEKLGSQNTDTKMHLDDYFEEEIEISQEIEIKMIFSIETNINEIEKEQKRLINIMKITEIDKEIFEMIKK